MPNDSDIVTKMIQALHAIAPETMGVDRIDDDVNLQEEFDLDSVDLVRYLAKLEEIFSISLTGTSYRSFLTIKDGMQVLKGKFEMSS